MKKIRYAIVFLVKNINDLFEYNQIVDLTASDGRAKKLNKTRFLSNSQVQEKKGHETKHNFFQDQGNNSLNKDWME